MRKYPAWLRSAWLKKEMAALSYKAMEK